MPVSTGPDAAAPAAAPADATTRTGTSRFGLIEVKGSWWCAPAKRSTSSSSSFSPFSAT